VCRNDQCACTVDTNTIESILHPIDACDTRIIFGRPVLPDVLITYAPQTRLVHADVDDSKRTLMLSSCAAAVYARTCAQTCSPSASSTITVQCARVNISATYTDPTSPELGGQQKNAAPHLFTLHKHEIDGQRREGAKTLVRE
jgi:hypothetical protein